VPTTYRRLSILAQQSDNGNRRAPSVYVALTSIVLAVALTWPGQALATFPGSPGLIALARSTDPNSSNIWVLDWRTGAAKQLTSQDYAADPDFSPNGRWIAFRSDASWHGYLNIWAVRANGTGLHRLTKGKRDLDAESPAFSANGRWVAFTAEPLGQYRTQIDRVALRGGHRQILIAPGRREYAISPAYSPDGRHLAWVEGSEVRREEPNIILGNTLGQHGRKIATGSEPQFSPDGASIVYLAVPSCPRGQEGIAIEILSLATGQHTRVKESCASRYQFGEPTFSPDGSWIVYSTGSPEKSELAFTPVPGAIPSFAPLPGLGTDLPADYAPSWQPLP
jgi:Tol biopolymer transport system component